MYLVHRHGIYYQAQKWKYFTKKIIVDDDLWVVGKLLIMNINGFINGKKVSNKKKFTRFNISIFPSVNIIYYRQKIICNSIDDFLCNITDKIKPSVIKQ
jgi:hypothetical protein